MPAVDPGGGGDEYPAGEYEVLSSETTVELLGVSDVLDVQQVTARALPSNVVFHVRFSGPQFTPTDVAYFLGRFSGYFNALSAIPNVVGVTTFEDIDAAGQLQDMMQVTVRSDSGRMSSSLIEQSVGRSLGIMQEEVAQLVSTLDSIEAGH